MKKSVKLVMIIVLLMAGGCTTQKKEENTKYNTYNLIRDLGFEDQYENLMKQYKSLKGKPGYVFNNVFVINSLINSDPEVLNKANISKFSVIDNYIYDYARKKMDFKECVKI